MGMNIYTLRGVHIGKRWAAGIWCWDCKEDLNPEMDVVTAIKQGIKIPRERKCPRCGKVGVTGKMKFNPAYRELGFNKDEPKPHRGIDGASGFNWRVGTDALGPNVHAVKQKLKRLRFVKTEYRQKWPIQKFWDMFIDVIIEDSSPHEFC